MNSIEKLLDYQEKIEEIKMDIEGAEIRYKGYYGTIMFINLNDTATIYLENEDGENWEEVVDLMELAKEIY